MKVRITFILIISLLLPMKPAKADLWGNDLPLLLQIVLNTMGTLNQLSTQSNLMRDELNGINDRLYRIQSIATMIQPSEWEHWKDPREALRRLQTIYYTLPKEYRTERSDEIETEISKAMNLISQLNPEIKITFLSGKEMERNASTSSPGVAQKMTASGVGTLIAMESQSQALQSQITSLLAKMVAKGAESESRALVSRGKSYQSVSGILSTGEHKFSDVVLGVRK
jgi:hypothetical protein